MQHHQHRLSHSTRLLASLLLCCLLTAPALAQDADRLVYIGLRAHLGAEAALKLWHPTADYPDNAFSGHRFVLVPYETIPALNERC